MPLKKRGEKSSVPLAHNQAAMWRTDHVETRDPGALQRVSESHCFQASVPRRDRIEAHSADATRTTIGVSKRRSARAVRRSSPPSPRLSHPSKRALLLTQIKNHFVVAE